MEAEEGWGRQPGLAGNLMTNSSSCADLLGDKEHLAWDKRNLGGATWEGQPPMVPACLYPLPWQAGQGQSPSLVLVSVGYRLNRECLDSFRNGWGVLGRSVSSESGDLGLTCHTPADHSWESHLMFLILSFHIFNNRVANIYAVLTKSQTLL